MIIDGNLTVSELIKKLEQDIAEQTEFLNSLKKVVTIDGSTSNGHKPKQVLPSKPKKKAISKSNVTSAASRAKDILQKHGEPLAQTEIRNRLRDSGVDTSKPTYLSSLYTALTRRPEWFIRLNDGRWALVDWDIDKLNSDANAEAHANQLFETV